METLENRVRSDVFREVVLTQDEASKKSHKALFSLDDSCYVIASEKITDSILSAAKENINKLHISVNWENILRVALWVSEKPAIHDVLTLIKKAGLTGEELLPFKNSDVNDILPWLYYGKRFDILRRICNAAKSKAEAKLRDKKTLVHCHLVSDESGKIVASSL